MRQVRGVRPQVPHRGGLVPPKLRGEGGWPEGPGGVVRAHAEVYTPAASQHPPSPYGFGGTSPPQGHGGQKSARHPISPLQRAPLCPRLQPGGGNRVKSIKTARFSALSGGFSHVLEGGRAEASKKRAEARWKIGKGGLIITPRLKPGAKRSRLKPADKADTRSEEWVESRDLSALRIDSLSSNRFLSPASSRTGGDRSWRHESTAFGNAPQSANDCRIDFGRPQKWTQNRVRWTSVLPILRGGSKTSVPLSSKGDRAPP